MAKYEIEESISKRLGDLPREIDFAILEFRKGKVDEARDRLNLVEGRIITLEKDVKFLKANYDALKVNIATFAEVFEKL